MGKILVGLGERKYDPKIISEKIPIKYLNKIENMIPQILLLLIISICIQPWDVPYKPDRSVNFNRDFKRQGRHEFEKKQECV